MQGTCLLSRTFKFYPSLEIVYWHKTYTLFNLYLSACLKVRFLLQVKLKFNGVFQRESLLYWRLGRGLGLWWNKAKVFMVSTAANPLNITPGKKVH